jgi:cold shock CspA family protein
MRSHGTLKKWNDDRGFGFITPSQGSNEIFVHISNFPRDGVRPRVNELISFDVEPDKNGKLRAVRVQRPESKNLKTPRSVHKSREKSSFFESIVVISIIIAAAAFGYSYFKSYTHRIALESSLVDSAEISKVCDGRTMCSQMTSCAEAKWFINHCPGTKMDGNHDGIPCVQQWCSY